MPAVLGYHSSLSAWYTCNQTTKSFLWLSFSCFYIIFIGNQILQNATEQSKFFHSFPKYPNSSTHFTFTLFSWSLLKGPSIIYDFLTRGPWATIRSPEWHSHCRHADVMQHLSNPIIATNENIIIWAVLSFEEEYMGLTVNGAWSWINYQSHFNRRINVKFGGNWLSGFWRIVILYM